MPTKQIYYGRNRIHTTAMGSRYLPIACAGERPPTRWDSIPSLDTIIHALPPYYKRVFPLRVFDRHCVDILYACMVLFCFSPMPVGRLVRPAWRGKHAHKEAGDKGIPASAGGDYKVGDYNFSCVLKYSLIIKLIY